jgi:hypothetical protein
MLVVLIHASDPQCYLVTPADLETPGSDPRLQQHLPAFRELMNWIESFICQPHPALGREGAVCPYVSISREKGLFWLAAYPGARLSVEEVGAVTSIYRDWFLALEPRAGTDAQYKTLLITFPDIAESDTPAIIDQAQLLLKPTFVQQSLMIGQFHAVSDEPGVWNPAFRPLRSPVPLLVMRPMVPHDILFLTMEKEFVRAYLESYGHRVPRRLRSVVQAAAEKYKLAYPPDARASAGGPSAYLSDQSRNAIPVAFPAQQEQA